MPLLRTSLLLAALLVAPVAAAGPPPPKAHAKTAKLDAPAHRAGPARSVGSPTNGHLVGGAHLVEGPYLRVVPVYVPGDARWGVDALVSMIDRAAHAIKKQFPDAMLSVGHLSRPGGGEIDRHASHESGRDGDVGFYVKNQQGKAIYADHFVPFKGDGTAPTWPGAQFDDARNWALVTQFVSDANAHVTHIFVASPIRTRLLQYAEKIGAPAALRTRAAELMMQPHGSLPHDDHFHVRVACPSGSADRPTDKCVEIPLPHHHSSAVASHTRSGKPRAAAHGASAPPGRGETESKNESFVPNLSPAVPGLDAVVIPAPLGGLGAPTPPSAPGSDAPITPPPVLPIDDPDGVLEKN